MAQAGLLGILIAFLGISLSSSDGDPATVLPAAAREFLEEQNQARAAVGVAPLKWSEKLGNGTNRLVRYQRNNGVPICKSDQRKIRSKPARGKRNDSDTKHGCGYLGEREDFLQSH